MYYAEVTRSTAMTNTGYLPLHHQKKGFVVRLQLSKAAWITCLLPFTAFVFCIIWSLMYNFEDSTFTHCKVSGFCIHQFIIQLTHFVRGAWNVFLEDCESFMFNRSNGNLKLDVRNVGKHYIVPIRIGIDLGWVVSLLSWACKHWRPEVATNRPIQLSTFWIA